MTNEIINLTPVFPMWDYDRYNLGDQYELARPVKSSIIVYIVLYEGIYNSFCKDNADTVLVLLI